MDSLCFKSSLFVIEPGEDEQTNPQRYGKQLASWLRAELSRRGYDVAELIPEDWGWCVMCSRDPFMLWVGCGNVDSTERIEDAQEIVWMCFVASDVPILRRLFGKVDTKPAEMKLYKEVAALLESEPKVRMVECP